MDLSVIIPARGEEFLGRTIQDLLEHIEGNTEIIAILDGYLPNPPLPSDPRVTVIYHPEAVGQRKAANDAAKIAKGKYLMKVDAHVAFDQGFDVKMLDAFKETGDNVTMIPQMKNLHAFDWVCKNGHRRYQSPSGPCEECKEPTTKDVVWIVKHNPTSRSFCFDSEPHFQYFGEYNKRPESQGDITESMSIQGSCFMCTKEKYFELDFNSDEFNSWGSQGIEIACKTWLSGGRVLVNKRTWYCHLFRTRGGDFGFPYHNPESKIRENKHKAKELFFENKWPKQIRPLSWLVEKFWPVKGWTEEELTNLKLIGRKFVYPPVSLPSPESVANLTMPMSTINIGGEEMTPLAINHSGFPSTGADTPENVDLLGDKSEVGGITTESVVTNVVNDKRVSPQLSFKGSVEPGTQDSMNSNFRTIETDSSVPKIISVSGPVPTAGSVVNNDFREKSDEKLSIDMLDSEETHCPQSVSQVSKCVKGICYYTHNGFDQTKIGSEVKSRLQKISDDKKIPIVSASDKKIDFGIKNIHFPTAKVGWLSMFKKIVSTLEHSTVDIVYFAEHDVLYHPSHFDFTPPDKETFYYNQNVWFLRSTDGHALHYDVNQLSGLCVYRETALKHFRERLELTENGGFDRYKIGFEPFTHNRYQWKNQFKLGTWKSEFPNVDVKHGENATGQRWKKEEYRNQSLLINWTESEDTIPGWPKTQEIVKLLQ